MNASDFDIKSYIELRQETTDSICEAFDVEIDPTAAEVLDDTLYASGKIVKDDRFPAGDTPRKGLRGPQSNRLRTI